MTLQNIASRAALARASTFLFVPGNRPQRVPKALASGAGAVIVDLEDAVAATEKTQAREQLAQAFAALNAGERARLLVRINAAGTPWHDADLALLGPLCVQGLAGVMIPKAEAVEQVARVAAACVGGATGKSCALIPLVESAAGLAALDALAFGPQVLRLALGHLDLQADLGMRCDADEVELLPVRFALVAASRRAGLAPPIDGVTTAIADLERLQLDVARSRRFGFGAKLCIHPAQVAAVTAAFAPTAAELDWARRVLQAQSEAGGGAFSLDGRMVDAPVLLLAQNTLAGSA